MTHDTLFSQDTSSDSFAAPFTTPLDNTSRFSFDEQVVACFPDMIRRSVPGYGQVLSMLPIFARRHCQFRQTNSQGQKISRVYDLGCSLGAASMALLQANQAAHQNKQNKQFNRAKQNDNSFTANDIQIKAIDISPAMTTKAKALLSQYYPDHDIEVINADVCDYSLEPCDMVILNLTLQFLPVNQRLAVLTNCYQALAPGGILILTEKTHGQNEQDDAWMVERYYDFKRANGYSELEISGKRTALENVLITDTEQQHHQRLKLAGFHRCMTWFQFLNFTSIIAFR